MDPRENGYSILYNPPLYHLIQAGFIQLNLWLGVAENVALENLQVVTLLFASACPLVAVDLMSFLGVSERGVRVGALVMAFQPSLWIFGATLNNDILSILCILVCILFTVRWERTRRMGDILGIALSMGGGHGCQAVRWTAHSLRGGGIHCCIFPRSEALETIRGPVSGFFGGKCAAGGGLAVVSFASVRYAS